MELRTLCDHFVRRLEKVESFRSLNVQTRQELSWISKLNFTEQATSPIRLQRHSRSSFGPSHRQCLPRCLTLTLKQHQTHAAGVRTELV